jgi:hypothetical protein
MRGGVRRYLGVNPKAQSYGNLKFKTKKYLSLVSKKTPFGREFLNIPKWPFRTLWLGWAQMTAAVRSL